MTTQAWEAYVGSIPESELKIIDSIDGYIAAKGGYPVIEDGLVLGGIGISGANQEIDADIAEAMLKAIA
jgi:glc operon protein GlcG